MKNGLFVPVLALGIASGGSAKADQCRVHAAQIYDLPVELLEAIERTESGCDPYAVGVNRNKTVDLGRMQVNSSWLPKLEGYGIGMPELLDRCTNVMVGAWILAQAVDEHGLNWKAVGAYHSRNPKLANAYAWRVYQNMGESRRCNT